MINWNSKEAAALVALQRGIPITPNPFAELAAASGMDEAGLLAVAQALLDSGEARRFGAVFDARRLGYRSALCAMQVPAADLPRVAALVAAVPGVTHAYERGWPAGLPADSPGGPDGQTWPNLWFTLAAPADTFAQALGALRSDCAPYAIDELPALRRFKIDVVFDARTRDRDERTESSSKEQVASSKCIASEISTQLSTQNSLLLTPSSLLLAQRAIVRLLQGDLPLAPRFFAPLAGQLNISEDALLSQLREWQANGVLRRIGLLLRHREIGFKANGMCCWDVPGDDIREAGRRVASAPEVTHCYERPRTPRFPFRLYAMIHTSSWRETQALFQRITADAALPPGRLLLSLTEFKKTSMRFFD